MTTMTHEERTTRILNQLREVPCDTKNSPNKDGWFTIKVPRVGTFTVHRMSQEACASLGCCEVWIRFGPSRDLQYDCYRGSAEKAAVELCKQLKAPSKAIAQAAEVIMAKGFEGFRAPEIAAMYQLDEMTTYKAFDYLIEKGLVNPDPGNGYTTRQVA